MNKIKIGDIVTPKGPVRKEQLGNGIIVSAVGGTDPLITVIYPSRTESFIAHDFRTKELELIEVSFNEKRQIETVGSMYSRMMKETQNA